MNSITVSQWNIWFHQRNVEKAYDIRRNPSQFTKPAVQASCSPYVFKRKMLQLKTCFVAWIQSSISFVPQNLETKTDKVVRTICSSTCHNPLWHLAPRSTQLPSANCTQVVLGAAMTQSHSSHTVHGNTCDEKVQMGCIWMHIACGSMNTSYIISYSIYIYTQRGSTSKYENMNLLNLWICCAFRAAYPICEDLQWTFSFSSTPSAAPTMTWSLVVMVVNAGLNVMPPLEWQSQWATAKLHWELHWPSKQNWPNPSFFSSESEYWIQQFRKDQVLRYNKMMLD